MFPVTPSLSAVVPPRSDPASAPAPVALSTPAMAVQVEWQGAVRPPDAASREAAPEFLPAREPEIPTGPPPAFAANILDQLPESLRPEAAVAHDAASDIEPRAGGQGAESP